MVPENPFDIKVAGRIISDLYRKRLRFISFLSECLRLMQVGLMDIMAVAQIT